MMEIRMTFLIFHTLGSIRASYGSILVSQKKKSGMRAKPMSIGASVRAVSHRVTVKRTLNHQLTFLDPRIEKGGGERTQTVSVGHAVDDEHKCGDHAKRPEVVKLWLSARIVLSGLGGRGNEGREDGKGQADDGDQEKDPARRKDKEC
jgi:hypothetical protein